MQVAISSVLAVQIVAHAASSTDEVCGLLLGAAGTITNVTPTANVAANPARWFEIDPAALIAAHRAARDGGPKVAGYYHSHPSGAPRPSPRDAAAAAADGSIWLIVAKAEIRAFQAVVHGQVEGRFDPVRLIIR